MTMKMLTDVKGQGPPMVLVGGGLTGYLSWVPHQERLSRTRTVVRAQPLSVQHGLDERPLPAGYSIGMESRALAAALDDPGLAGPVDLVAWSYGAAITLAFALDHPERVRTLTLIEPPAFWVLDATGTADAESRRESDDVRAIYRTIEQDVSEEGLAAFVSKVGLCPPGKSPRELPQWPVLVEHRRSLRTGDAAWVHTDTAERLRAFDRPVLLVKGTGSAHFLHRIIDGLAATLPGAQVTELPGGHAPQIVAIDDFLARLAAFQAASTAASAAAAQAGDERHVFTVR
jgi:pimeloyl-ACP methyl ester carboxylesterase